jgi:hypothetical protein
VSVPLRCELEDSAIVDRRGSNDSNAKLAADKVQAKQTAAPRVLDALKEYGVGCNSAELHTAAGDVSKRVLNEVLARLRSGRALTTTGDHHKLALGWQRWPAADLAARVQALMAAPEGV